MNGLEARAAGQGTAELRLTEECIASFLEELARPRSLVIPRRLDVVTGTLAAPLITEMAQRARQKYPGVQVTVHAVENRFFGGNVSVAGLVTATDIIAQCKGKLQSRLLGVPEVMLQDEGDRFLDDVTLPQLEQVLGCRVVVIPSDGAGCCRAYLGTRILKPRRTQPAPPPGKET